MARSWSASPTQPKSATHHAWSIAVHSLHERFRSFAVLLSLVILVASFPAFAQRSCGDAPKEIPVLIQEQLKGDVTGKAQTFMKLGAGQIQGAVDASRTELYEQHKSVDQHQIDMYFMWVSCQVIMAGQDCERT